MPGVTERGRDACRLREQARDDEACRALGKTEEPPQTETYTHISCYECITLVLTDFSHPVAQGLGIAPRYNSGAARRANVLY